MDFFLVCLFGLLIGSFLNVCIYRVPRRHGYNPFADNDGEEKTNTPEPMRNAAGEEIKLSVTNPRRSFCPSCKQQLSALDNVPVLSWIILGGKCRHCRTAISGVYPFVESLSALAAGASYIYFGPTITAFIVYCLLAGLIVISFIDIEFQIIPDVISLPGCTIGLILGIISEYTGAFAPPLTQGVFDSLIGFLLGGGFFYALTYVYYWMTGRIGIGGGDIKLMAWVGAVLGWQAIPTSIFVGSFIGAVVGIVMMVFRRTGKHTEIAFGPWLALGTVVYLFGSISIFKFPQ